ncbi:MAG: glycosyltransferase family 4 protein [Candidatus Moranbacteria bacterium]|nr:glycosyltransferase family 4 protein [Candidatus Moranbacteria bacterium]
MIKFQKAADVIKRNGMRQGGKIVAGHAMTFLKSFIVGSGDILYITGGVGDSAMYRTRNVAEELRNHGFRASATVLGNPILPSLVDKFKIFVFHRTAFDGNVPRIIKKIKSLEKEIIFDTDDLIFDPKYLSQVEYYKNAGSFERKRYENGVGREIVEDPYVATATASTRYLAKKLEEKGKKTFIVRNKLSEREIKLADHVLATRAKIADERVCIGYFSGTPSHDKDLATITDALAEVLRKYPNARIIFAGPVKKDSRLDEFNDRIGVLPRVSRDDYYDNLFKIDINLAPLEIGSPFCEAKSEIKFIEAGILKIPTVAVRNGTFSEAIEDGENGMLAATKEEWVEKIGKLIEDAELRKEMGENARSKVLRKYTTKSEGNEEFYGYLKEKIERFAARAK